MKKIAEETEKDKFEDCTPCDSWIHGDTDKVVQIAQINKRRIELSDCFKS